MTKELLRVLNLTFPPVGSARGTPNSPKLGAVPNSTQRHPTVEVGHESPWESVQLVMWASGWLT